MGGGGEGGVVGRLGGTVVGDEGILVGLVVVEGTLLGMVVGRVVGRIGGRVGGMLVGSLGEILLGMVRWLLVSLAGT